MSLRLLGVAALFAVAALAPVWAQESPLGGIILGPASEGDFVRYGFEDAPGSSGAPAITDHRLSAGVILSSATGKNLSMSENFGHFGLNSDPQIPGSSSVIPRSLWSERTGANYWRQTGARRGWGASAAVGSDSDRLFNSIHETDFRGMIDAKIPSGERDAWLFFLSYSNDRYFLNNVPLPGVAYEFKSQSGNVRGLVGFPFAAVSWTPAPLWEAKFSLFGPRRMSIDISRRVWSRLRAHGGFDWGGQSWLPVSRPSYDTPLIFERKRLYAGVQFSLTRSLSLDVSGGRQFDQYFYESRSFSTGARASLPLSWYVSTALTWRFALAP